ncbi:hypothetical protein [Acaryochloris sp. IP29b_bin.148]|uniref:hypothetical protein n=1 Tax=Acaryochloris sp. IP29b_bin.148 TaxID=2969218 RepID=UPI00262A686E|nr:hypothetical protein [Acaryochloris sp. IP29b_bin.148]
MKQFYPIIKVLSPLLICGALGVEIWTLYALQTGSPSPPLPTGLFWFERFALTAHAVEGVVASLFAKSREQSPIPYGLYTFFVGTVGLLELLEQPASL